MLVLGAGGAPVDQGRCLGQGRCPKCVLSIAHEVTDVQTEAQSVIGRKAAPQAGDVADVGVLQQQGDLAAALPAGGGLTQDETLQHGAALGGMEHGAPGLEPGHPVKDAQGQLHGHAHGFGVLLARPGQIHGQVDMPAQGQVRQRGGQVFVVIGKAGAGLKKAQGHFIDAPGQKTGIVGHIGGHDKRRSADDGAGGLLHGASLGAGKGNALGEGLPDTGRDGRCLKPWRPGMRKIEGIPDRQQAGCSAARRHPGSKARAGPCLTVS